MSLLFFCYCSPDIFYIEVIIFEKVYFLIIIAFLNLIWKYK